MFKRFAQGILTIIFLVGANVGLSYLANGHFLDIMFFVGLAGTIFILFFSSTGGFTTEYTDVVTNPTNKVWNKQEKQGFQFKPNLFFIASLLYTLIGLIAGIYVYRSYF